MKHLLILIAAISLFACGGDDSQTETASKNANDSTELRDWAKSHTSRAELTVELAEAKMTLRLVEQSDPQSAEAKELKARIETIEQELEALKNSARQ